MKAELIARRPAEARAATSRPKRAGWLATRFGCWSAAPGTITPSSVTSRTSFR